MAFAQSRGHDLERGDLSWLLKGRFGWLASTEATIAKRLGVTVKEFKLFRREWLQTPEGRRWGGKTI